MFIVATEVLELSLRHQSIKINEGRQFAADLGEMRGVITSHGWDVI